jgi:micrococcal nuclease
VFDPSFARRLIAFTKKALILLVPLLFFAGQSVLTGKIVGVSDGDTVTLLSVDKRQIKIRLQGVDCPEKAQAFGQKAKQFTSAMVFGKQVRVVSFGSDRYGRTIGEVLLVGGSSLNKELVRNGFAWWYRQYAPKDTELQKLEAVARAAKLGLWADPNPVPPWDFRRNKMASGSKSGSKPRSDVQIHSTIGSNTVIFNPDSVYFNTKSLKYHKAYCPSVSGCRYCVKLGIEEAKSRGVACKGCFN